MNNTCIANGFYFEILKTEKLLLVCVVITVKTVSTVTTPVAEGKNCFFKRKSSYCKTQH